MAVKEDLDFTYTTLDKIFRLSMGDMADFSGARYNGDFSMTLEQAQRAKHQFMAEQLNIKKGSKVLDMGCGWGPFIKYATDLGAIAKGLTLSDGQYKACIKNGLDVCIKDVRTVTPQDFGMFDAIVSVGAFEHFCSLEEYKEGSQEKIYSRFFKTVHDLLPTGGRFYLQTMVFGKNMIDCAAMDLNAPKNSDAYLMALMAKHFPGSWLPYGLEMIVRNASPYFKLINSSSGRLDYIETTNQWRKRIRKFNLKKYALFLNLFPSFLFKNEFRHKLAVYRASANKKCFERELMDHYRIVFEKI
ncbi:MAG TPA: class I SAM-dependent methyltransferase [Chitinophagaceae bacterium]|nr:class I SAM-dependent methyltransferase [Chitinophagaceae bacterium]